MLRTKRIFVGALIVVLISTAAAIWLWNAVSTGKIKGLLAQVLPYGRSEADDGHPERPVPPSTPPSPLSRWGSAGGREQDNPSTRPELAGRPNPTSPAPVKMVDGPPSPPPNLSASPPPADLPTLPAVLEEGKEDEEFVDLSTEEYNRRSRVLLEEESEGIQRILELAKKKKD